MVENMRVLNFKMYMKYMKLLSGNVFHMVIIKVAVLFYSSISKFHLNC